jgi:hypothetical protein
MLGVNIACPLKDISIKLLLAYFSMFSLSDKKNSNSKLTIMERNMQEEV